MKDILFGMAVGGILGILLYKNNDCTKEAFDKGEKMIKKELEKMDQQEKKYVKK
ncbi:MAG: hypothetical protein PHQ62_01580 [Clostridia bacterium]|nr:hypothetical protein [Clostridia bacterium]